ncbi:MAG: efflux RND transporter permease subunit [Bryobacterales bacterium]|nr:efflux RND transporter permease subunit [Bryobacterales bacterium]
MLSQLIDFHLKHRWAVLVGLAGIITAGLYSLSQIPIDAFPDLTNNQVTVITECPAMGPSEVEALVTYPIETALMGLPRTEGNRSVSKLGLSMVTVIFDDDVNTYLARQLVNERLQEVRSRIPENVKPQLGPVATAFGEVYQYTLDGPLSAMEMKTLHEWTIKNQLRTIRGINEVNTWGGETRQYQIVVEPAALRRYNLSLRQVFERVRDNNENFGGGFIEHGSEQYNVRGLGRVRDLADIERIVLLARQGTPVLLRDVARVRLGPLPRQGAVTRDGKGETVSGMAIMLKGENGMRVIERIKERLATLRLPEGVKLVPFYDQSEVIQATISTVRRNLLEGGGLVILILLLFLGNIRAAILVAAVIPFSMLIGFVGMRVFGVSANLMSLGAIDFGMIVDGAVVMMENAIRRLQLPSYDEAFNPQERIREAAHEVARPILFGVAIIIAVYLPIFLLEGLEGRMFRPMAVTVCSALLGSLFLALLVVPTAAGVLLRKQLKEHREHWFEVLRTAYLRTLGLVIKHQIITLTTALVLVSVAIGSVWFIGTEFMPKLDEGSILIQTKKLPGISLPESVNISTEIEKVVHDFPEVKNVVSKLGRPDLATEAMGIYEADVYLILTPHEQWRFKTKPELIDALDKALQPIPGVAFNFTQPMAMRLDETVSGVKADLAVKIFGEDPRILEQQGERALRILSGVKGSADVQMEILSGVAELTIEADRAALARYGLNISDVRDVVEVVVSGTQVSTLIEGQRRFDVVLRLPDSFREDIDRIRQLLLTAPGGESVPLGQVAKVSVKRGPEAVNRESGQRRIVVQSNVRGRDLGSFVADVQERLTRELHLPPGYWIDYGGQFENQKRATERLLLVIPITFLIIFGILFATFDSVPQAFLIILNVPFALVGGIAALWARQLNLNLSASIGFIALFGVAVLNGIVLVSAINRLRETGMPMSLAVVEGAGQRLRPVLMTALVASLGFIPMAVSQSSGAEVQRPLATVVIGGLITSTLLTLFILPVLYPWFSRKDASQPDSPDMSM